MPNRLAGEQSLYLRQHSDNPVDWYPWGPEAFERARREDRPILLSIGYSACHWCHVMERESFEDPEVARAMNEAFVCVKVDREERPDVDGIYMRAVQALTGHGGWPLTVFLTPEGYPFYGGTYFPPEPRHGIPSFPQLLSAIRAAWADRRGQLADSAERIGHILRESTLGPEGAATRDGPVTRSAAEAAARRILDRFDPVWGGFGNAPKFPQPAVLEFLLEHDALAGEGPGDGSRAREAVLHTLRRMAAGGIRDHLGGGFHRYSVDREWRVPHFEKMLYDNALLASVYLRAHQATGAPDLLEVARAILDDMLGDFRSPEGGFYAARDADSEGEEGRFYLWTPDEVDAALGEEEGRLFRRAYDVSELGNFEGRNLLHLPHDPEALAREEGIPVAELAARLAASRRALAAVRAGRVPPVRDEKILAGWNALLLRALAEAGAALGDERYLAAATEGARWLLHALRPGGRLLHQVPGPGGSRIPAFLEDVAGFGNALLSLHEATLDPEWLERAVEFDAEVEERFRDRTTGLLHDTPDDHEGLVVRPRETMDNPTPSGSSLAAELHLRLGRLLGDEERIERARAIVAREAGAAERVPAGFGRLLAVLDGLVHAPVEVAVFGRRGDGETEALLRTVHARLLPGRVVTGRLEGDPLPAVPTPLLEGRGTVDGRATAYVCSGFACRAPSGSPETLGEALAEVAAGRR